MAYDLDKYGFIESDNKGDIIGITFRAYLSCYDPRMAYAINNCWGVDSDNPTKIRGIRHPENVERKMSRDHFIYSLCTMMADDRDNWKVGFISRHVPFGVSNMHRFTLSLVLWTKAIAGNKIAELLYYLIEIMTTRFIYVPMFKAGYSIAKYGQEVEQSEWETQYIQNGPKWRMWIDKIIFPSFALLYSGFQIYTLGDNFPRLKEALKKSYRPMVGKTNYVQKILFGMEVTQNEVDSYKPMHGGRWSGNLNGRNDRWLYTPKEPDNTVDRDLLVTLFNERYK